MTLGSKTVFVLGAGFTKAFVPDAPLMEDNYDIKSLSEEFSGLHHARHFLETELNKCSDGKINIERLMTRLHSGMPYDFKNAANEEMPLLLSKIMRLFMKRIEEAKNAEKHADELAAFARYCVENRITCITFNYDDVLDQALWEVRPMGKHMGNPPYWHPDGGYGFFCRPSLLCIKNDDSYMDLESTLLLKLHGSINWYPKLGSTKPYVLDAIMHHESWCEINRYIPKTNSKDKDIENHLEPDPFIVPPVLVKSDLTEQSILRLIWTRAYEELEKAGKVVFLGYSFPETDMVARFLFSEAIKKECQIEVVNIEEVKEAVKESYRKVFPGIADDKFNFDGILKWSCGLNKEG